MKKLIPIVVTLIALVGAFLIYFSMQSKFGINAGANQTVDQFPEVNSSGDQVIKAGSGAWSKQFDKDGNLYYQFKCAYYDPQPDGTVKVKLPVIQFFLSGGQIMQIEGKTGSIRFPAGTDKGVLNNSPTEPPRYGILQDVSVSLFNSPADLNNDNADMAMMMANAAFDNDTYRLYTQEDTDESGKIRHEDEVPVSVNSKDYSFTGSGLVLYWNDLDKRLKSLEISHGKDLTLLDAGDLTPKQQTEPAPVAPGKQIQPPATQTAPVTQNSPVAQTPPESRHRYTATFYKQVRVVQDGQDLVNADQMDVDFAAKGNGGNAPAAQPSPAVPSSPASLSATTTAPAAPSETAEAPKPIHIFWNGPMKMVPTDPATAEPLTQGKAIVRLAGLPVRVHERATSNQPAADIQCNNLKYNTEDSSAHLSGDVFLKQFNFKGPPSIVQGQQLDISRRDNFARLEGPGKSSMADPKDPTSILQAAWEKRCTIQFYSLRSNQAQLKQADLEGDVQITHPRFDLTAQKKVQLKFDPLGLTDVDEESGSAPLREIVAEGNANCIVHEANNQDRQIGGQTLKLFRDRGPDGKLYAKRVECNGSVHAQQGDEQLTSQSLAVDLLPTTRRSASTTMPANADLTQVTLDKLVATGNVQVQGKDGSAAQADDLEVQVVDDHPHVKLIGSAEAPAMVKNKTSTITGPLLQLSPHDQTASIEGPGTFNGLQQSRNPNEKPRPLKMTWKQNASLDGNINQVIVNGTVTASSDDDSTNQSATCDRIVATLVDVAPTTPSTQPAKANVLTGDADFMRNKQIKLLSMQTLGTPDSNAKVESYAHDAGGYLLHQYDLLSRKIDFDVQAKRVKVDGPGRILAREQSPPAAGKSGGQPATEPSSAIGGDGATAIEWQKRFVYDDSTHSAAIEGDVTIVHQGIGAKSESLQLDHANIVQADFFSDAAAKDQASPDQTPAPKLKQMNATGPMVVRTMDKTIKCGEIDFDAVEKILTCRGGQLGKVIIVDDKNIDNGSCDEAVFNMKTNELKKMTNVTGQGRN